MPKNEPAPTDPMELVAIGAEVEGNTLCMAESLAGEFLSMGLGVQEVMKLFRSAEYALAHRAWNEIGEVRVFLMVSEIAQRRAHARTARGGIHA
jgi:hypothetical protein